jgi:acylphosphatase
VIGEDDAVARMIEACREGPFGARVSDVAISDAEDDGSAGFTAKPTV